MVHIFGPVKVEMQKRRNHLNLPTRTDGLAQWCGRGGLQDALEGKAAQKQRVAGPARGHRHHGLPGCSTKGLHHRPVPTGPVNGANQDLLVAV